MSEFIEKTRKTKTRTNPNATRIDFTPMVDLGFLLITFFMLTTSLSKPNVLPLIMPDTLDGCAEPVKASKILNLLLGAENQIYWYEGLDVDSMQPTDFSADGLRSVVLEKRKKVNALFPETEKQNADGRTRLVSEMYVCIKPLPNSVYKNTVDVLDEMAICRVGYYAILEADSLEVLMSE